jgi:hypothetical protein
MEGFKDRGAYLPSSSLPSLASPLPSFTSTNCSFLTKKETNSPG